jgi:hypothetical protein
MPATSMHTPMLTSAWYWKVSSGAVAAAEVVTVRLPATVGALAIRGVRGPAADDLGQMLATGAPVAALVTRRAAGAGLAKVAAALEEPTLFIDPASIAVVCEVRLLMRE